MVVVVPDVGEIAMDVGVNVADGKTAVGVLVGGFVGVLVGKLVGEGDEVDVTDGIEVEVELGVKLGTGPPWPLLCKASR